jgi:hypothetical protein
MSGEKFGKVSGAKSARIMRKKIPKPIMRIATARAGEEFFRGVRNDRDLLGLIK